MLAKKTFVEQLGSEMICFYHIRIWSTSFEIALQLKTFNKSKKI